MRNWGLTDEKPGFFWKTRFLTGWGVGHPVSNTQYPIPNIQS